MTNCGAGNHEPEWHDHKVHINAAGGVTIVVPCKKCGELGVKDVYERDLLFEDPPTDEGEPPGRIFN